MHNTISRCVFLVAIIGYAKSQTKVGDSCVDRYTSTVGRCKAADACESARIDYQQNGIRPTFCTYSAFGTTLVCCRDGGNFLHTAVPDPARPSWGIDNNRPTDERRVSERNDKDATTEKPSDDVIKPFIHYYAKDDIAADQPASPTHGVEIEDRDFSTKDHSTDTVSTEEELIAKVWAMKLKRLLTEQRRYAEKIINDVLFEAEMGTLTKDHVNVMQKEIQKQMQPDTAVITTEATKTVEKEAKKISGVVNTIVDTNDATASSDEKGTENLPILQLQLTINNPEDKNN